MVINLESVALEVEAWAFFLCRMKLVGWTARLSIASSSARQIYPSSEDTAGVDVEIS